MGKTIRALLISCLTMACCIAVIAVATYAMFSDTVTLTTHLSAGTLKVTLVRTAHSSKLLNNDGVLEFTETAAEEVDFTTATDKNALALPDNTLFVPESEVSATFKIANESSVAFSYWVDVNFYTVNGSEKTLITDASQFNAFAKQLQVTVTPQGGRAVGGSLGADNIQINVGSSSSPVGVLYAKDSGKTTSGSFTITVKFVNSNENNAAQNASVYFDMVVTATQYVSS